MSINLNALPSKGEDADNLGAYYWHKGQYERAITAWEAANELVPQIELDLKIAAARIKLGQNRLAISLLEEISEETSQPALSSRIQNQLGNAYLREKYLEKAAVAYQKSWQRKPNLSAANNLASLFFQKAKEAGLKATSAREEKQNFYRQQEIEFSIRAKEYAFSALIFSKNLSSLAVIKTLSQWQQINDKKLSSLQLERGRKILLSLPLSREKIVYLTEWSRIDIEQRRKYWLDLALKASKELSDLASRSYILLQMAQIEESRGNLNKAAEIAFEASFIAQSQNLNEIASQASWLRGRIYQKKKDLPAALSNYRLAVAAWEKSNFGIKDMSLSKRLNFAREVEPMYRQTLEILLQREKPSQENLTEAVEIMSQLKVAQLQKYFGDNCLEIVRDREKTRNPVKDKNRVIIYSILLSDRSHFILQRENGSFLHHAVDIGKEKIETVGIDWFRKLEQGNSYRYLDGSRFFYELFITPFESAIKDDTTIVFAHDGVLKNLPMSALLSEKNVFLAQKWVSISSLGFNLDFRDRERKTFKTAAFGLENSQGGRWSLDRADEEVNSVVSLVGGSVSINENFNRKNLQRKLKDDKYQILHLATHGYFGGIVENSFVLSFEGLIKALELEQFLLESSFPIDLLVLSACETALGNELSVLGISGLALRTGIDSVLGSLWLVQDTEQADLMTAFYRYLGNSKETNYALALNQVQQQQIEEGLEPRIWAAVNLIQN